MKRFNVLVLSALFVFSAVSCQKKEQLYDFDFSVSTSAADASTPVVVSVNIDKGDYDGYQFWGTVSGVSSEDGGDLVVNVDEFYSGNEVIRSGDTVSFPNSGHRDLSIIGVSGGTYRVNIRLRKGDSEVSRSALFVVKGDDPYVPDDPDDVLVTSFTVPGAGEETDEKGNIVLRKKQYNILSPYRFTSTLSPSDATARQLLCSSSDVSVLAAYVENGDTFVLAPKSEGVVTVKVWAAKGQASASFGVRVNVEGSSEGTQVEVEDFSVPEVDSQYGRLCIGLKESYSYVPSITPANATDKTFRVISGDNDIVEAAYKDGKIVLTGKYPGRTSVSILADGGSGILKTVPVMVYADVRVEATFEELEPTEAQLKSKTFPCKMKFTSDCPVEFPLPVTWSVSMKSIVNKSGKDSQTVSDKTDVRFYGNVSASYNITEKILIPSYLIWRSFDYNFSLTLEMVRNNPLDPELWRMTFDDVYKTQDARIKQYIVNNLQ